MKQVSPGNWRGVRLLGLLALAVVGTAGAWVAMRPEEPHLTTSTASPLLQAKVAMAEGDWAQAEELLRKAGASQDANLLLGRVLLERGRVSEAQTIFAAALKEAPKNFEATCGMAAVWEGLGQVEMAASLWQKATVLRKDDPSAWKRLALAQQRQGDVFGALSSIQQSLKLDPGQEDLKRLQSDLALFGLKTPESRNPQSPAAAAGLPLEPPRPAAPHPPDPSRWFPKPDQRR